METLICGLLTIIFAVMTVISVTEVVRRYILGLSFPWADELCRYLLVWLGFLGAAIAARKGKLVKFDLGHDRLSERSRTMLAILVEVISILFMAFIFYYSLRWATSFSASKSKMLALPFTLRPVYMAVPVGVAFYILFVIEALGKSILKLTNKGEQS